MDSPTNIKKIIKRIKLNFNFLLYKLGIKTLDIETLTELKKIGKSPISNIAEFHGVYIEDDDVLVYEKLKQYEFLLYEGEFIKKSAESLSNIFKNLKIFSRNQLKYMGFENEVEYFKRVILYMITVFFILFILDSLDGNILAGFINGVYGALSVLVLSIFYPKIRLILFKGEIKLQVLFALLYIVSILRSGASLPEVLETISKSSEYGILSFEAKNIIRDVNVSGYSLSEALERAKLRTEIPLLKKMYDQMIIGYNKGNLPLLLEKLYEDIVRESMAKLDSSKFMIQNLGNLTFGVGLILPFAGMILSTMIANQGFPGILNTLNFLLTKIGPLLTLIFGIFVKLKIE